MSENPKSYPASDIFLEVLKGHRQWVSVKAICDRLISAGYDAVLAGGCVRDGLLGVSPKDFDVATDATPDQVESLFPKTIAVGKNFGVIVIPVEGGTIEVATFRSDGAYADGRRPTSVRFSNRREDAIRRDFTVNALFYDPKSNLIIDYVGGMEDLNAKRLRAVGTPEKRFEEDKLRILRAVRFAGQLSFEIDDDTCSAIKPFAKSLTLVSRERIRDETDKLLMSKDAAVGFALIADLGLGSEIFQDWASLILPPHARVSTSSDLDVRRALLFYPAFKQSTVERVQERLRLWKYGRGFIDLVSWLMKNEERLRARMPDPKDHLLSRALILQKFEAHHDQTATGTSTVEARLYSQSECEWMSSLELWTDEKAVAACEILDLIYGVDHLRDKALARRGLALGKPDPQKAKADELMRATGGAELLGPAIGRSLRRLNREILLR